MTTTPLIENNSANYAEKMDALRETYAKQIALAAKSGATGDLIDAKTLADAMGRYLHRDISMISKAIDGLDLVDTAKGRKLEKAVADIEGEIGGLEAERQKMLAELATRKRRLEKDLGAAVEKCKPVLYARALMTNCAKDKILAKAMQHLK